MLIRYVRRTTRYQGLNITKRVHIIDIEKILIIIIIIIIVMNILILITNKRN